MADIDPEKFVDHYKIWEVTPRESDWNPKGFLDLVDQFHVPKEGKAILEGHPIDLVWIANQVRKDGKPEDLKDLHFAGWTMWLQGAAKAPGKVGIKNQFTAGKWVTWERDKPTHLLTPAGKSYDIDGKAPDIPTELDHYLCYPVKKAGLPIERSGWKISSTRRSASPRISTSLSRNTWECRCTREPGKARERTSESIARCIS